MSPECEDLPLEAAHAMYLANAFRDYSSTILIGSYGFDRKVMLRDDFKWHFVNSPGKIKDYVLREFDGLDGETDSESRRLTRELERGFISHLRRGYLIAWGREGSPLQDWSEIPSSAWRYLWPARLHAGVVEGEGARLFDVRVKATSPLRPRPSKMGRPSSADIIKKEFARRIDARLVGMSLRAEAKYLSKWLGRTHPNEPHLHYKSIEKLISKQFNDWLENPFNN